MSEYILMWAITVAGVFACFCVIIFMALTTFERIAPWWPETWFPFTTEEYEDEAEDDEGGEAEEAKADEAVDDDGDGA